MRSSTRPPVVLSFLDHSRSNRILLHVTYRVPEMGVVEDAREEAFLPEMPVKTVFAVEVVGIEAVQIPEATGSRFAGRRYQYVVHMVRHEAIRYKTYTKSFSLVFQKTQVFVPVIITEKNRE